VLQSIASWVNHATGRGSIKKLESAMVPLNALLFSPRLIASRLQLLNPVYYAKLDPFARKQAVRGMGQLLGSVGLTLGLAELAGADVVRDPRNTDFGKIKIGNTRIDIAGGFQQYIVAASRWYSGESVSSTTGEVTTLAGGFNKPSRADILTNFAENKLAPVPAWAWDYQKNENFAGDEFDPVKETGRLFLPLGWENAYEGYTVDGPAAGAASFGLGGIGFGVQTYTGDKSRAVKRHEADMAKLKAEAKRRGREVPQEAVVASRRIRDLDIQLRRAEKKKGKLTYRDRAELTRSIFLRAYPQRKDAVARRFAEAGDDMGRWEKLYKLMRSDLREPYSRLLNSDD
jgi:hypothetical protein